MHAASGRGPSGARRQHCCKGTLAVESEEVVDSFLCTCAVTAVSGSQGGQCRGDHSFCSAEHYIGTGVSDNTFFFFTAGSYLVASGSVLAQEITSSPIFLVLGDLPVPNTTRPTSSSVVSPASPLYVTQKEPLLCFTILQDTDKCQYGQSSAVKMRVRCQALSDIMKEPILHIIWSLKADQYTLQMHNLRTETD